MSDGGNAAHNGYLPGGVDAHLRAFERPISADLGEHRQADPKLDVCRHFLLTSDLRIVDAVERNLQRLRVIATVVDDLAFDRRQADVVRKRVRRQQILAPQLGRVHPQFSSGDVQQPLAGEGCLRLPSTPIGRDRCLVGQDRHGVDPDVRDAVRTRDRSRGERGVDKPECAYICAHVGHDAIAQSEDRAVAE